MVNTILAKRVNHIVAKGDHPVWPKGSKSHGFSNCREVSDLIQYAMRSCGIPVAADFIPYSPDYRYSHEWNVVRDTTGKYIQFGFDGFDPVRDKVADDGRRKGKVYRYCYALQNEREVLRKHSGWNIGGTEGLHWKDVTSEYFGSNQVAVNVFSTEQPFVIPFRFLKDCVLNL